MAHRRNPIYGNSDGANFAPKCSNFSFSKLKSIVPKFQFKYKTLRHLTQTLPYLNFAIIMDYNQLFDCF